MKWVIAAIIFAFVLVSALAFQHVFNLTTTPSMRCEEEIQLPEPREKSDVSVEEAIKNRRSVRSYTDEPLDLRDVSQLLWAAQGITDLIRGFRAAPSAGALYPLEVYVVIGNRSVVWNGSYLKAGVYHYEPQRHCIEMVVEGDLREELCDAAVGQVYVREAPVDFVICAVYERTTRKYGERGVRYVHMEAGHAAQNMYLQCESLGLGMVVIGAFYDDRVQKLLNTTASPLYVIPVGHPR